MTPQQNEKEEADQQQKDSTVKPDPDTLHTPDPQANMEGPVSSTMQKIKGLFNTDQTKEEADDERDKAL